MAKNRNRVDIVAEILTVLQEKREVQPTHLMYRTNLSYIQFRTYVDELLQKGLMEERTVGKRKVYGITDLGSQYRHKIQEMRRFEERFGL